MDSLFEIPDFPAIPNGSAIWRSSEEFQYPESMVLKPDWSLRSE